MIFVTCGSSHMPFHRLMQALGALPAAELNVQHGPAAPPPCAIAQAYLTFEQVLAEMQRADIVVSHAGVGSIMCALQAGHVPIIFPRLKQHGETVDDHQAELAEALAGRGTVLVARNAAELVDAVAAAPARSPGRTLAAERLSSAVRAAIRGEPIPGLAH